MTNKQILETAIQKAIDGGWSKADKFRVVEPRGYDGLIVEWRWNDDSVRYDPPTSFIYNHDFAKALWSPTIFMTKPGARDSMWSEEEMIPAWQHHLQQMVIAPDPIKYLGENI